MAPQRWLSKPSRWAPQATVGRAGRFGTKGLAITFVSNDEDAKTLEDVQSRFEVSITQLPEAIDVSSYMTA